ncbi:MAG: lipopolysaccharide kinase InaA family protein [Pseudomonadales bacterium]
MDVTDAAIPLLTLAQLASAERDLELPFAIVAVTERGEERLVVTEILRLLPGRRLAARARLQSTPGADAAKEVMLKLFYGDGATGYCQREHKGYKLLQQANLQTPECLGQGDNALLYRWLPDAQTVSEFSSDQLDLTVERIGMLHRAGLIQTDMHLENFLFHEGKVWLLDPDGVRSAGAADPAEPAYRDNLAILFAQLSPNQDLAIAPRLMRYCHGADLAMDSQAAARLSAQLPNAVEQARARRVNRYLDKTLRDCTEFHAARGPGRRFVCRRESLGPMLKQFAQDPEAVLHTATVIKAGNTATVMRVMLDGESRIVKRYNIKGAMHRLRQSLRSKSRAERSWRNGHRLRFLRIPTPEPIALLETRHFGLRDVAYLITEDLGQLDLLGELKEQPLSQRRINQIVELFESLRLAKLCHGDTKATNLLVHNDALYLIDLDSMRTSVGGFDRDRERFANNWPAESELGRQIRSRLGL